MVDPVEEFRQINVHHGGVAAGQMFPRLRYRRLRPASPAEAVAAVVKGRLKDRFQHLQNRLLHPPVYHIGNPHSPRATAGLGYPNPPEVAGTVTPLQPLTTQLWQQFFALR